MYLRRAIDEGSLIGPRILSCGHILTQTGGHGDVAHFLPQHWTDQRNLGRVCDGPEECRKAAREQFRAGADFIKLCSSGGVMSEKDLPTSTQFTVDEIRAMAEEAHAVGAKIASHAQATRGIKNALLAGVDTIEHGIFLDDETIEMMLKQGTYLIPTLAIVEALVTKGAEHGIPQVNLDKARFVQEAHLRSFERAVGAGVKIGLGADYLSDPLSPMGHNADELLLNVKAGRRPMDVLVSATRTNAEALGISDKVGTLEPGRLADLLVVQGDPLADIRVLADRRNIARVYKSGALVPRLPGA
jgi:imidazolonepropionase-like amidohydrolase